MIDSHAHIDGPEFDSDRDQVLARARAAGVEAIICIGAGGDLATPARAVALAEREPDVWATVGVHPHDASSLEESWWTELERLGNHPRVVGIGETGLDYYYDHSDRQAQRQAFDRFLELAAKLKKPVICHIRDAHADAKELLADRRAELAGGVIHCFTGTPEDAKDYADMGLFVSFSGIVTFKGKSADPIRAAVAQVPLEQLLIETDCPYLAPVPMRGRRNEPAFVVHTAEVVAHERGVTVAELGRQTAANTRTLFALT